jgi:2-polyprenyl-6-hydroxyphenyl methylase/3-demethylubiquinone-9 3-methyltransferase
VSARRAGGRHVGRRDRRNATRAINRSPPEDQAETDGYWNAIVGNGGAESMYGWCKDKGSCPARSRRVSCSKRRPIPIVRPRSALDAMMKTRRIDVAAIEAAWRG